MLKFSQIFPAAVESEAAEEEEEEEDEDEEESADDYRCFHTSLTAAKARIRSRRLLSCAKCSRTIDIDELYMNLPSSNMDRRRAWCSRLGFHYDTTIRRFKSWNAKPICARHFDAADVRLYAASKVRIERFALPSGDASSLVVPKLKKVTVDAMQQRQAWRCTMCRFVCWCAYELYNHVTIEHLLSTNGRAPTHGYLCPFCRRCAYGYRTLGGFRKHIACAPHEHFLLRKMVESAVALGRDAYLHPIASWFSWREENVSMALFGQSSTSSMSTVPMRRVAECGRKMVNTADDRPTATAIFVGNGTPIEFDFSAMIEQESTHESNVKLEPIEHDDNYTLLDNYGLVNDNAEQIENDQQHSTIVKGEPSNIAASGIYIKVEALDDRDYMRQEFVDVDDPDRMYDGAPPDLVDDEPPTNTLVDVGMLSDLKTIEHNMPELIEMPTTDTIDFVDDDSTTLATTSSSTTDDRYFLKKKANQLKMLSRQMESAQNRRRFFGPSSATTALENNDDDDDFIEQPPPIISASGRLRALDRCGFVDSCCQLCGIQFYSQAGLRKHYVSVHHNDEDDERSDN